MNEIIRRFMPAGLLLALILVVGYVVVQKQHQTAMGYPMGEIMDTQKFAMESTSFVTSAQTKMVGLNNMDYRSIRGSGDTSALVGQASEMATWLESEATRFERMRVPQDAEIIRALLAGGARRNSELLMEVAQLARNASPEAGDKLDNTKDDIQNWLTYMSNKVTGYQPRVK